MSAPNSSRSGAFLKTPSIFAKMEGVFKKVPDRDEFGADIKEALIVELYSR